MFLFRAQHSLCGGAFYCPHFTDAENEFPGLSQGHAEADILLSSHPAPDGTPGLSFPQW